MNQKPLCIKDNLVEMVCSTETCLNSPFICQNSANCICSQGHTKCKIVLWNGIMEKVQNMQINQQLKQKIALINEHFQKLKKQIQIAHQNFLDKITIITKTDGITFTQILMQGDFKSISQRFINSLFSSPTSNQDQKLIHKKQIQTKLNLIDQKFKEILEIYDNMIKKEKMEWDKINRSPTIQVTGNVAKQTKKSDNTSRNCFILMSNLLNKGRFSWAVKMLGDGMRIGICIKNIIIANNFGHEGDKRPGHGAYVIGSGGYTYNHKKGLELNSFKFTKNDILYLNYDSGTKKLNFKKNTQKQVFSIDIPAPQAREYYYPCVYLYNEGWGAQIIES